MYYKPIIAFSVWWKANWSCFCMAILLPLRVTDLLLSCQLHCPRSFCWYINDRVYCIHLTPNFFQKIIYLWAEKQNGPVLNLGVHSVCGFEMVGLNSFTDVAKHFNCCQLYMYIEVDSRYWECLYCDKKKFKFKGKVQG